jgi:hypothetical protein
MGASRPLTFGRDENDAVEGNRAQRRFQEQERRLVSVSRELPGALYRRSGQTSDGSWDLVRALSNKPELVVVVRKPVSEQRMRGVFEAMDSVLRTHPEVGEYNQKI